MSMSKRLTLGLILLLFALGLIYGAFRSAWRKMRGMGKPTPQ